MCSPHITSITGSPYAGGFAADRVWTFNINWLSNAIHTEELFFAIGVVAAAWALD